jgi:hypothetical protein
MELPYDVGSLKPLITAAVEKREQGNAGEAARELENIFCRGLNITAYELAANALGECIVCWKHLYERNHSDSCLDEMDRQITFGLAMKIPDRAKAPFHLRKGDLLTYRHRLREAEHEYRRACELLAGTDVSLPEYKGHWAKALSDLGYGGRALKVLHLALQRMDEEDVKKHFPLKHWRVLKSGLLVKQAEAALRCGHWIVAASALVRGYKIARTLANEDHWPVRLEQYHRGLRKLLHLRTPKA